MHVHPFFNSLILHTNNELSQIIGKSVLTRKTLHEWPLSCLQQLVLQDGTKRAYKTQLPPSVEPAFYDKAQSPLLPHHQWLGKLGQCETMLLDWIEAPMLSNIATEEQGILEHGKALIEEIGKIQGDVPVYLDISAANAWQCVAHSTLEKLQVLVTTRQFTLVDAAVVKQLQAWAQSPAVIDTINAGTRLTHGDLKAEQVFVTEEGYKVIDWQRPVIAPPDIDLVSLLVEQFIDPRQHVHEPIVEIYWFLRLHWAVTAQADLFQGQRWPLFDQWAREAVWQLFKR